MFGLKFQHKLISHHRSRNISIGTNILENKLAFQKARPWYTNNSNSNMAIDNMISMKALFKDRKVVIFGVPAPFTGICTNAHVPGYKKNIHLFLDKGIDEIICYSVTCPYAHYYWAKGMDIDFTKISFLADVDASFAKEYELDRDYSAVSLGVRSERFSMYVDNGIIKTFQIVKDAANDAEELLKQL